MIKEQKNFIIFELFIVILITILTYATFSKGMSWQNIQSIAALMFFAIFLPLVKESRERKICIVNAKSMILTGVFLWVLLDPLMLRAGIEVFPPEIILKTFLLVFTFLAAVYVGYIIRWKPYFASIFKNLDYEYEFDKSKLFRLIIFSFFLGLLPLLIWGKGIENIISILTHGGRWTATWGRGALGGWQDWIKTGLNYFGILGTELAIFYLLFIKRNALLLALTAIIALVTFNTGTRTAMAMLLLPPIILYYLHSYNQKRKTRYLIFIWAYLLLSFMQLQFVARNSPPDRSIEEIISDSFLGIVVQSPISYHRDDQFFYFAKAISYVPEKVPYTGEFLLLRPIYHFVPRAMWPGKPRAIMEDFEEKSGISELGLTVAISIIGEAYICQGWLGVCMMGIFIGFLAKQFDSLIEMSRRSPPVLLVYSYGVIFLMVSIRSYQIVYEGWYVFVFLYLILKSIKRKRIVFEDT